MKREKSAALFQEAEKRIPGGVNSPVRAFKSVGGNPLFIKKAKGSKIVDADGNRFIDYVLSWGPMIVGHAHPKVVEAIKKAAENGTSFGAPTALEIDLAKSVQANFPLMERVRFVNSGTEATMSAIRLARAFTRRNKIIKFEGCYHGHADSLLVKAGSGATTLGIPDSPGVHPDLARDTITLPFNNLKLLQKTLEQEGNQIACVIVEPVPGNMGTIVPEDGYLPGLRELTRPFGTVLIFDEVMSGFRIAPGGAQERYGIRPDLTCLGKIIGGGLPVGAYGGKREIMEMVAPVGPVYQAGTLSGNPIAMAAGLATLSLLKDLSVYEKLERRAADLAEGLADAARKAKISVQINRVASQMTLFFNSNKVADYTTALQSDRDRFSKFFLALLEQGVYLPPSQFEAFFLSTAHSPSDIEQTVAAAYRAFKKL
ncbi:MAG: glutamate-1-semialdehyde 2,1-aminomutase [Candidatus Manganitrophus sp.]|uniref:Glutamate-1-semialdehyde 2,1-aminomutase n=1 Tax=Candidatus Manganitrophus noduliformans TaxID=2606439 RepID=A0A7X6DQY1_9BACT|nr:glutamate-1-semialdehyde 2,1-aminomutase [Candidatus Manganitrophus noduliformans]MDC4206372.1 glutamate-1-semialdehyde 2,1-aminomutase [Candidatus Manganitrophus sp.]NKE71715.1 glutamate-1-semialdehyde-2,1-aminomutase [Candidatus Manganitrophus noduliformans]WDT69288.1 MAG: glutamate-1-semialdehyde 2,1-aminomutase [Candidatus Manganitrophus sp.]